MMATAYHPPRAQHSMLTLDPDHADADPAHLSAIPVSGSAAIRNHTRAIVTCLGHSTLAHSSSPLATLIYHLPHTREPGFWLHPRMLNAPFDAAHAVQPVHVAALCGSWPWFAWLVSLPPGKDLDGAEDGLEEQEDATPNEPMSTRSAGHVQMQGPNIVRVPALTDLRAIDDKGWNLMHYAVLGDAVEYARWIKEGGTWDTYLPRFTALVFMHHEQVARALCSEREGTAGLSPLDVAVAVGAEQSVLYLLERGLVPRVQVDLAGRTPLHHVRHASMLMLLLAVHPVKVRRWMQVHDLAGMPAWVYALRLAAPSQVLDMMVSYLDVVYEDGGMWLPGSDHKQVRDVARASIAARMHKAELSEREAKLILSWTNREAVGIGKEDEWALAKDDDEQGDVQGTMYDSAAELPPPPPYEPPPRPPTDTPRPASSASSRSAASTTSDNPADLYVKVNCSHAPCPFPRCKYSTTPLYCDQLSLHLEQDHSAPLAPIRHSRTKIQCSFPGCSKTVLRLRNLKPHVVTHAPANLYACTFAPGSCSFTNATRRGVRFHVQLSHLANGSGKSKSKVGVGKEERDEGDQEGSQGDDEAEWEVWEGGVRSLGLASESTLSLSSAAAASAAAERQVARKSMGTGRHNLHPYPPRGVTPAKIEVEVPLITGPPHVRTATIPVSTAKLPEHTKQRLTPPQVGQPASKSASPMPEPAGHAVALPLRPQLGGGHTSMDRQPTRMRGQPTSTTTPLDSTISEVHARYPTPLQPQSTAALSHVAQQDGLSPVNNSESGDDDDDDILDVTPVQLQARRPSAPPAPLTWPSYLPTLSAPRPASESSNVVVISDSDDDMDMVVDEPLPALLAHHATDTSHALFPLALASSSTHPTSTQTYATPSESSTFWATALKHTRDSPSLHASLARQYFPHKYTGPAPFMYMHRPTGQPFISFSLPDSTTTNFVGHLLVPVPAVGIHIEHQVAAAVGKCALPAELQAVLAQATRRHYVDRVRRPVEVLSAVSGEGVYFVVSREQASVRAAELVGRVIDGQGWRPTGVHVPPIVQVTVGEDGPWKRALIVVVRKKVLEWLLLGLGYAKPGEEAHACVADPLVVWY